MTYEEVKEKFEEVWRPDLWQIEIIPMDKAPILSILEDWQSWAIKYLSTCDELIEAIMESPVLGRFRGITDRRIAYNLLSALMLALSGQSLYDLVQSETLAGDFVRENLETIYRSIGAGQDGESWIWESISLALYAAGVLLYGSAFDAWKI